MVGRQEGLPACKTNGCWLVGGDDLTGVLCVLQLRSSLAPIKSRIETFRNRLTQVH